jgi:hypothetical protein
MFIYKLYKYSVPTFASPDLHYRYSLTQILTHRICQRFTQKTYLIAAIARRLKTWSRTSRWRTGSMINSHPPLGNRFAGAFTELDDGNLLTPETPKKCDRSSVKIFPTKPIHWEIRKWWKLARDMKFNQMGKDRHYTVAISIVNINIAEIHVFMVEIMMGSTNSRRLQAVFVSSV